MNQPRTEAAGDAGEQALAGLRILAVDDSIEVLEPFAELLRHRGAFVTEAASGAEALRFLEADAYDLLISDIGMPRMNGYQLMAEVRRRDGMARIRAIALTGFGHSDEVERAIKVGFDAHLPKPPSVDQVVRLILDLHGRRPVPR